MKLEGKVVAITGAYSGLGAALAHALAKKNCKLVLVGRDKQKLAEFASKFNHVKIVVADIRNESDCKNIIDFTVEAFGHIDIIINNAGVWAAGAAEEITPDQMKHIFEANVFGTSYCCKYAVMQMKKQKNGLIINVASTAGIDHKTGLIAYSASKHAIVGFTGSLEEELKGTGVRAVCFCPGGIKTNIYRKYPEVDTKNFMEPSFVADHLINQIEAGNPDWLIVLRRPK